VVTANPSSNTVYTLSATAGPSCTAAPKTVTVNVTTCTDVNELDNSLVGLTVYPNPNNGDFTIRSNSDIKLNLINELGQVVKIILLNSDTKEHIISDLSNGVYFLMDETTGKTLRNKIVVIK